MSVKNENLLLKVSRPSRYLGNEVNSIKKDPSEIDISVALAFPDVYEVGMSHQGLKILYHILNQHEWLAAERVYTPWVDMEKEMRAAGITLVSLETKRPMTNFDIIGFSLQHELCFTNVLNMLDLSGIPFLSSQRDDSFPLIIAGGPACFNPEPIADIFDAVHIGDGEETTLQICRVLREAKRNRITKQEVLRELINIKGVYVPSFFRVRYQEQGTISDIEPKVSGYEKVEKAIVSDIDQYPFPSGQVVPYTQLVHDRLAVEISRGCTRGCRFCQAGMIYRPVRDRSPESVIKNVEKALRLTGYENVSLLSLSSGDYNCIAPLIKELMDRLSGDKIAVSLPSLRIDSMDPVWLEQIKRVRKTGFTMAPEVGNDRLRNNINKSITNKDILNMAYDVYGAGWNLIKLYFMTGLPGEEEKDTKDIIGLARQVAALSKRKGKRPILNISVSTFVPKAHTPFMWAGQIGPEESWNRINMIRNALGEGRIRVKWNQPDQSWLEGVFSRGDRRLTKPLIEAWKIGARFDAWGEHFIMDLWKDAFNKSGINPESYLHQKPGTDETMPWDHIRSGVDKDYFKREWEKALKGQATPDCRDKCLDCGVCDHKSIAPVIYDKWSLPSCRKDPLSGSPENNTRKYRLTFSKKGPARYLSHLELARTFIRALRRAGIDMVFSKGYHPLPRVSFASALPVGTESNFETVDIKVRESLDGTDLMEKINRQLPDGIRINSSEILPPEKGGVKIIESHFQITTNGLKLDRAPISSFMASDYFPVFKKTKKGEKKVNARAMVKSLDFISPHVLELVIKHMEGPEIKPIHIIKEVFQLEEGDLDGINILKTKQVMD